MTKHTITLNDVQVQILREAVAAWKKAHTDEGIALDTDIRINSDHLGEILSRSSLRGAPFDGWDQAHRPVFMRK